MQEPLFRAKCCAVDYLSGTDDPAGGPVLQWVAAKKFLRGI